MSCRSRTMLVLADVVSPSKEQTAWTSKAVRLLAPRETFFHVARQFLPLLFKIEIGLAGLARALPRHVVGLGGKPTVALDPLRWRKV